MRFVVLFLFTLSCTLAKSQDMIILSNGDIHEGKVKEVAEKVVKYNKKELPGGPIYSIEKSKVFMIKYENGYTEVFKNKPSASAVNDEETAEGVFTDPRDGNEYTYKKIGGLVWFTENLRFKTPNSSCYDLINTYCEEYGQYYNWEEAQEACPDGWHLASDKDWIQIEVHAGMAHHEAEKKGWRGTYPGQANDLLNGGSTGLNLLFTGFLQHNNKAEKLGEEAFYWTSSARKSYCAWMRHLKDRASIEREEMTLTYKLPVRCVQD